jgi:Trp operon repressor
MKERNLQDYGLIFLSILTLITLLAYTFVHTGGLLSEYVRPQEIGYVAAFGVEAAIITMSIRIGKLLRQLAKSAYRGLEGWLSLAWQGTTLLFVLAVSAAANIVEGHKVKYELELTLSTIQDLDGLQVATGLLATGLIPIVVFSMTEIISGEIKAVLEKDEGGAQVAASTEDAIEADAQTVTIEAPAPQVQQPALPNLVPILQSDATPAKEKAQEQEPALQPLATDLQKPPAVSEQQWRVWQLVKLEGKPQAEVAEQLGKSISTISRCCTKVDEERAKMKERVAA